MALETFNVCTTLWAGGTIAVGTANVVAFKAPTKAIGGGITVVAASLASKNAIAAGSAPNFELVTLGTDSAINGTVGTIAAAAFTAGTVKNLTITTAYVDASYMLAWKCLQTAVNADQIYLTGMVQYQMGK